MYVKCILNLENASNKLYQNDEQGLHYYVSNTSMNANTPHIRTQTQTQNKHMFNAAEAGHENHVMS